MILAAFILGLMSSLHCLGMCGPILMLTLANDGKGSFLNVLSYQIGRTGTYVLLGFIFGLFGTILSLSGIQSGIGIALGATLIILALISMDLDALLFRNSVYRALYGRYSAVIGKVLNLGKHRPVLIGILNGLLPCGVVYLALVGAIATNNGLAGAGFMLAFGLGTWPIFFVLSFGSKYVKSLKGRFNRILPIVQLCMGIFIIVRTLLIDMPLDWEFWAGLADPTMCHTK